MISPHGGILVNRIIRDEQEINRLLDKNFKKIEITKDVLLDVECISNGVFSPLIGFPSKEEIDSILNTWRLKNGIFFPIPPLFHVSEEGYNNINLKEKIILMYKEKPIGIIEINGKSRLDKLNFIKKIFNTIDPEHPGVFHINNINPYIISGEIYTFGNTNNFFNEDSLTPLETRREFERRGWKTITAFSTTGIPHRAHEYLQRIAMDITDGLFIHALNQIGTNLKYTKEQIKNCYSALINNYYNKEKVLFSFLPILSRSGGPREVGLQAVIRQNYGVTHFIVGRDHAGFKNIYGKYDSQKIFERFSNIKIKPLLLKEPVYCKKCKLIVAEESCNHHRKFKEEISGVKIRGMMRNKEKIPEYFMRKEVLDNFISK